MNTQCMRLTVIIFLVLALSENWLQLSITQHSYRTIGERLSTSTNATQLHAADKYYFRNFRVLRLLSFRILAPTEHNATFERLNA